MTKAYWVAMYHEVRDPAALAEYARLAGPAITAAGGRILARGLPAATYDSGRNERTVVIEFDSVAAAKAAHASAPYQEALKALGNAVTRDIRIIESA